MTTLTSTQARHSNSFPKAQKLCNRKVVERVFEPGASKSVAAFPVRLVVKTEQGTQCNKLLISVPKRHFKHAVDRNRVKRQLREAYRLQRATLRLPEGMRADMALLWLDNKHYPTEKLMRKVQTVLQRMTEILNNPDVQ